jgi:hypothetical protein
MAITKGYCDKAGLRKDFKASEILDWLKQNFDLGRGHGMALVAMLKGKRD